MMYFMCHKKALSHLEKKKEKGKQHQNKFLGRVKALVGLDELVSKLKIAFSMVSYLSTNAIFNVGWYLDNGASRHMTFDMMTFYGF